MTFPIATFTAEGIAGGKNYTINFGRSSEEPTIIVGPNGTGKSVFLSLYYLFITAQWVKLSKIEFNYLSLITRSGDKISISSSDLLISERGEDIPVAISRAISRIRASNNLQKLLQAADLKSKDIYDLSRSSGVPPHMITDIRELLKSSKSLSGKNLFEIELSIEELNIGKVLYLPTFRRIEKDISAVFPEYDARVGTRASRIEDPQPSDFIELAKFGMRDVDQLVSTYISMINARSRQSSSRASQEFIRDMVRGKISEFSFASSSLDVSDAEAFVSRLDKELLADQDKIQLSQFIRKSTKRGRGKPSKDDQYLGYFVSKMHNVFEETRAMENALTQFKDTVNRYFYPDKEIRYDLSAISVVDVSNGSIIKSDDLSSGEKQIYAVFAYLLLSNINEFIVLIDEPELSLSVPWQKSFLVDIIATGRCKQLFSVTHSPFIVANPLEDYMIDIKRLSRS